MAPAKGNQVWIIGILIAISVVFVVLAFKKDVPPAQAPVAKAPETQAATASLKVQESVVMPPKQIVPQDSFAIQVYSFKEKTRAEAAITKLKDKGHNNSYIMVSDLGARGIWYRVRVGPFTNEGEAQKVLEQINAELKSGIIVTE